MNSSLKNRWWISAELVTVGNLRIGSGDSVEKDCRVPTNPAKTEFAKVAAVATDHQGKPWLPGASLRGALRAWLEKHFPADSRITTLFGPPAGKADEGDAGCLAVFGAGFKDDNAVSTTTKASDYWSAARASTIETGVAIDRVFGVASDRKLYYREVVPEGVRFRLEMEVHGGDLNDLALLRAALDALGQGQIPLGADGQDGKGEVRLQALEIRLATPATQEAWIADHLAGKHTSLHECASLQSLAGAKRPSATPPATLDITLHFDSLFCVNDPGRVVKKNDHKGRAKSEDFMPRLDAHGRPLLPASSFRGVLRSQMEKIARTLNMPGICGEGTGVTCPTVTKARDAQKLCPVCALLGTTGWRSTLKISDFASARVEDCGQETTQEFVAIDRFTGGGLDGAKFNARAFYRPRLKGCLELSLGRLALTGKAATSLALLQAALRDMREGDLRFGAGASRGYGQIRDADYVDRAGWKAATQAAEALSSQATELEVKPLDDTGWKAPIKPGAAKGNEFLNPYHFASVPKPDTSRHWQKKPEAKEDRSTLAAQIQNASHARYLGELAGEPVYSGRILCRLTAETPFFIGGERQKGMPATATHFMLEGKPAIPASSLRGLISSMVETATGSALRVLEDRPLSFRKGTDEALSALGMVVVMGAEGTDEETLEILPITLPTLSRLDSGHGYQSNDAFCSEEMPQEPMPMKIYVNGAKDKQSHCVGNPVACYVSLDPKLNWKPNGEFSRESSLRFPKSGTDKRFAIGQCADGEQTVEFRDARNEADKRPGDSRCVLRVMRSDVRKDFPKGVRHELLLPLSQEWENEGAVTYQIHPHAKERFEQLADERTAESIRREGENVGEKKVLPYHPIGTKRNLDPKHLDKRLRLKAGDLVYYRLDQDDMVEEISFSAIWRGRVENKETKEPATVRRFFEAVSPELLPFNSKRQFLSPAELMFGYAADDKKAKGDEAWGGAAKGRVFPGDGLSKNAKQGAEVTLKILDAPKPPSPTMYFRPRNGTTPIAKKNLNPSEHQPNGRKFYLHQPAGGSPWVTKKPKDGLKQKVSIRPVQLGAEFVFHLDFENLSAWELGALCYALRPEDGFRHKLGMGKPLGLGTVRIDPLGLFLTDRPRRYGEDASAPRYHHVWLAEGAGKTLETWKERYPREADASDTPGAPTFDALRQGFRAGMEPAIRKALLVLGDPAYVGNTPVHYPLAQGQTDGESQHFEWFVRNAQPRQSLKQTLKPVVDGLPRLERNQDAKAK